MKEKALRWLAWAEAVSVMGERSCKQIGYYWKSSYSRSVDDQWACRSKFSQDVKIILFRRTRVNGMQITHLGMNIREARGTELE